MIKNYSAFQVLHMLKKEVRTGGRILLVPIEDVLPAPFCRRSPVSAEKLCGLTDSIRRIGIISPLSVRSLGNGKYMVISGERRREAALKAGLEYLPCVLINADSATALTIKLCDNMNRENIHYLDVAAAIYCLLDYLTIPEISYSLCVPEGLVLSELRLINLPDEVKQRLIEENIDEKTAFQLSKITDKKALNNILDIIKDENCDFEKAEERYKQKNKKKISGFYSDITVFTNTIEKAVKAMAASGISVDMTKNDSGTDTEYLIKISRLKVRRTESMSVY